MASQDDRNFIQAVRAIPSTAKRMVPSNEDRERKWKNPPVPIPIPGHVQFGLSAVKNPYTRISTNPTAKQTILNKKQRTPRKTVRPGDTGPLKPLSTASRDKGKGRAVVPPVPFPSTPSPEVIDVDADHASTDDLNISPGSPSTKSPYFNSKVQSDLRKAEEGNTTTGTSLIADGDNTKQLRALHDRTQQRPRSTSPISSYTEDDEMVGQQALKPNSKVRERVAEIEERAAEAKAEAELVKSFPLRNRNAPVVDFRSRSIKNKMQPKAGFAKSKLALKNPTDALSEPSGLRRGSVSTKQHVHSLPISKLVLGIQKLLNYDLMEFENEKGTIKFTSSNSPTIGPIGVAETFYDAQCSDLNGTYDDDIPIIIHLRSSLPHGNISAPWQLNYDSVFQKGARNNKGQITIVFNPKHERWNTSAYRACIDRLLKLGLSRGLLRLKGIQALWSAVSKTKYVVGYGSHESPTHTDEERTHRKHITFESDVNPGVYDESQDSDLALIEPPPRRQRVTDSCRTSYDESTQSLRKRPPDPHHRHKDSLEDGVAEPPSKRQRTEEAKPLRRSTRRSAQQDKAAKVDLDEVVLVYPFGAPGAVNITLGDLNRLEPEEFLNDTLIEFGLKSWLKELEFTDPALAAQVHVFNSFFYKKLNKRSIKEGYDSVRKWTSKIDIFSKKYIIIPINENLHWYLGVIYEPEHVLRPPPPSLVHQSTPMTRKQARESRSLEKAVELSSDNTPAEPIYQEQAGADDQNMPDGTASENEVEQLAFSTSCSITVTSGGSTTTNSAINVKELVRESGAVELEERGSPMEVDPDFTSNEVELPAEITATASAMESDATTPIEILESPLTDLPNGPEGTPARFYGKSYVRKQTRRDSDGESIIIGEDALPRTKVFILDSLGNRHLQAVKQLTKWLEMEASDKRKVESITPPVAKMAPVPVQPNYCDCGLYILHFAATFLSDPQRYCHIIMTKERPSMLERRADWKDASVSLMRENLRQKILRFSDEWHQMRATREVQKQENAEGSDEDSDVAIVEHVRPNKKGKLNKSARTKS